MIETPQDTRVRTATVTLIDLARSLLNYQFPDSEPGVMSIAAAVQSCSTLLDLPEDVCDMIENIAAGELLTELTDNPVGEHHGE